MKVLKEKLSQCMRCGSFDVPKSKNTNIPLYGSIKYVDVFEGGEFSHLATKEHDMRVSFPSVLCDRCIDSFNLWLNNPWKE